MSDVKPAASVPPEQSRIALTRPGPTVGRPAWVHGIRAAVFLYLFVSSIKVMGGGLKAVGDDTTWLRDIFSLGHNPIIALMAGVIVTAVVQSSSFTTALIITLCGTGQMEVETAIYAVMGANIGTSITSIIVSLGNIKFRRQFRRGFTAAMAHTAINWLTVAVLFPIEWISNAVTDKGVILRFAEWVSSSINPSGDIENPFNPITWATYPVMWTFDVLTSWLSNPVTQGVVIAIMGLVLLFFSLYYLVASLKGALLSRLEGLFRSFFFRNDAIAFVVGVISTVLVQSSSVTTSLIVPLASAGAVRLRRIFPFLLGCNIGTTVTGVIAALASMHPDAITVAAAHITFNVFGTVVWYPLRAMPISLARTYGRLASKSKRNAIIILVVLFLVIPSVGIVVTEIVTAIIK